MARAGRIKGIRPKAPLRTNARLVVIHRLEELLSWRHALTDATAASDLHNMRIAAKRLRYALEIFEVCFPGVKRALKELTGVQEAVGDIHDLDLLTQMMRERLRRIDASTEELAVQTMRADTSMAAKSNGLRRALYAQARDRRRLGLLGLVGRYVVQRETLYTAFQKEWGGTELDSLAARVLEAIGKGREDSSEAEEVGRNPAATPTGPEDTGATASDVETS